ncbi:MAG: DUF5011 domain-containing protein, partial [Gammaproteobacteria bacterium]|nr:DUF5011 domain-containing protein [Gammaproteobacteria bacterium]
SDVYVWGALSGPASDTSVCTTSPDAAAITFTMLDPGGAALANSSITAKGANQFQTPTCGTLTYDTSTQTGSAEIAAFAFFANDPSLPATAKGITIAKVPAGLDDGSGNLILANMLFDWNGTLGIPVSISYSAAPLLDEMDGTPNTFTVNTDGTFAVVTALVGNGTDGAVTGVAPASDGTYTNGTFGYLNLGPVPLATTEFDTTNVAACTPGSCSDVNPSADITQSSAVADLTPNSNEFAQGDGFGIGGNPMQDGPFPSFNANFDFTSMKLASFTDTTKPVLTLTGNSVVTVIVNDPYNELGATCKDAAPVGGNIVVAAPTGGPIDTSVIADTVLTYTCTDTSSNQSTVTRTVKVVGPNAVITLNPNAALEIDPVTQECAVPYVDASAVCTDDPDGNIPIVGDGLTPGSFNIDVTGVNVATVGLSTARWNCTDSDSNTNSVARGVNVVDTTLPVITINAALEGGVGNVNLVSSTPDNIKTYTDQGASVMDTCDTALSAVTTTGNIINMVVPDTGLETIVNTVTYRATDNDGNLATKFRTVNVTRSQPVITLLDKDGLETDLGNIVIVSGSIYTEFGMNVHDAQQGDIAAATLASGSGGIANGLSYTISGTVNTAVPGDYPVTYTALDSNGNNATTVERIVTVADANTFGVGNFTMLEKAGNVFGGTNDVVIEWDEVTVNSNDLNSNGIPTDTNFDVMSIGSPFPFFNFNWFAHHIRVFRNTTSAPITFKFDVTCTSADYDNGTVDCNRPLDEQAATGRFLTMTLQPGEIGGHILFDWNGNLDIDVLNFWKENEPWDTYGDVEPKNQLWVGAAGIPPAPDANWRLVSSDVPGDGVENINGSPMIDGPFKGFFPNFNFKPDSSGEALPPFDGQINAAKADTLSMGLWALLAGLLSVFGLRRIANKK